jgi:hypothetical protein
MDALANPKFIDPSNRRWWLSLLAGMALAWPQAQAQMVVWGTSASFMPLSYTSDGAVDHAKLTWQLGWFTNSFVPTADNWAQWQANWHPVASDHHRDWGGIWAVAVNTEDVGSLAAGKQVYVFAFNDVALLGTPAGEALLYRQDGLLFPNTPNQATFDIAGKQVDGNPLANDLPVTVIWGRLDRRMYEPGGIVAGGGTFSVLVPDSTAQPPAHLNGTFEAQSGTWPGTLSRATAPSFSCGSGTYPAGQAISIAGDSGATIHYRLNGGAEQSAPSPVTSLILPAYPPNLVVSAYARISGQADSAVATATYTVATPFQTWIASYFPGVRDPAIIGDGADPDGDRQPNFFEFALGGDPSTAANRARIHSLNGDSEDPDTAVELLLTIAVRIGTPVFAGAPSPSATKDGVTYTVQGSTELTDFSSVVLKVAPVATGLPAAPSGYEYRSFSLAESNGFPAKGFLRVRIAAAP